MISPSTKPSKLHVTYLGNGLTVSGVPKAIVLTEELVGLVKISNPMIMSMAN